MSKATTKAPTTGKLTACYVRVSTTGQNEVGQRAEIERWAKGNGISRPRWFVDKKSGDNLDRPAWQEMQKAIFNGEIGTVVVWRLDRLSRRLRDGLNALCDLCERGIRVVSVTQQIDFNGTVGKIIAAVLMGVAQMEQEARKERQAAGIAEARKRGKYKGRRRGSFKLDGGPQRAMALKTRGSSASEIAAIMGIGTATVWRYLRHRRETIKKRA